MKIRATLRVRNAKMLEAREAVGLTQIHVAKACGVPIAYIQSMEAMDFSSERVRECVPTVAGFLDIPLHEIMPDEIAGVDSRMDAARTCDIEPARLIEMAHLKRIESANVIDPIDAAARKSTVDGLMKSLSIREQSIIRDRFFNNCTLEETGLHHGVSRERARSLEARAIRKMQNAVESQGITDPDAND